MPINFSNFIACGTNGCNTAALPTAIADACDRDVLGGRINDIYFIDCSEEISNANLIDTDWWAGLITDSKIHNLGVGIGSYAKKNSATFDAGGCGSPTIESIEWAIQYELFCIDKGTTAHTHEFANALLNGATKNYNVVARLCGGDNLIVPIGKVDISDFDNILPNATDQFMSFKYEFSWKSMTVPHILDVAGLSTVLAKATRG